MKSIVISSALFVGLCIVGNIYFSQPSHVIEAKQTQDKDHTVYFSQEKYRIVRNSNLAESLMKQGVASSEIYDLVQAAKPVKNLGYLRAKTEFQTIRRQGPLDDFLGIKIKFSPVSFLEVKKSHDLNTGEIWTAKEINHPVDVQLVTFSSKVETSLWDSAIEANMEPQLIAELTEIFAWQVDFNREVRMGDRWRLTVEQKFAEGKPIGWGRVISAEYENSGELYTAVLFRKDNQDLGYFAPDGSSLRRMFLKSPIRFGRITSGFKRKRFHPILKRNRPHLGVDYGAPRGTPVRAVGDGSVILVGTQGGGGKTIKIRHNGVYQTAYKHLNGYAQGIRRGAKVRQGQIIGYVGSTGLSTGPHLHFEFYENRRFVDPLGKKFPSADPVPSSDLKQFQKVAQDYLKTLPPWYTPGVTVFGPVRVLAQSLNKKDETNKVIVE